MKHDHLWSFKKSTYLILLALPFITPIAAYACASCGCTLSSDWENLGFSSSSGVKLDVRYDYLNQNQLRSGTNTISSGASSQRTNDGNPQEVEKFTRNNYMTIGVDYSINPNWGRMCSCHTSTGIIVVWVQLQMA